MNKTLLTSGALWAAALLATVPATAASYSFTTIDAPGAIYTQASGINNSGEIVGTALTAAGAQEGFVDVNGAYTFINVSGAAATSALGVNSAGEIVGSYLDSSYVSHGFVDIGGVITTFNVASSTATSIAGVNASGTTVGFYGTSTSNYGFMNSGGTVTTIAPTGANSSIASGINNAGTVVGYTTTGFEYVNGTFTTISAGTHTEPNAINNLGEIVGEFTNTTGEHGFTDIGGVYTTIDDPSAMQGTTDITGVNDSGTILGNYTDAAGNVDSFIGTVTPEPASFLLMGVGVAGLGLLRRKRA